MSFPLKQVLMVTSVRWVLGVREAHMILRIMCVCRAWDGQSVEIRTGCKTRSGGETQVSLLRLMQWGVNSHITHMWNHLRDLLMTLFKAPKTTNDNFLSFFQVEEEMIFPPSVLLSYHIIILENGREFVSCHYDKFLAPEQGLCLYDIVSLYHWFVLCYVSCWACDWFKFHQLTVCKSIVLPWYLSYHNVFPTNDVSYLKCLPWICPYHELCLIIIIF